MDLLYLGYTNTNNIYIYLQLTHIAHNNKQNIRKEKAMRIKQEKEKKKHDNLFL